MKKTIYALFTGLLLCLGMSHIVKADEYLRIGMEAAYAPFNWTQEDDSNGAVKIDGTNQYANGYDVQIAKKVAEGLGKKPLIVKTSWNGLIPALTSGKIDMIIAGMSPTAERKKEVAFSNSYYTSEPVMLVRKDGNYANATSLDAYVSERPEALTAESANSKFKMIQFKKGFEVGEEDATIAIGMKKGDTRIDQVNAALAKISSEDQVKLMDDMIKKQPASSDASDDEQTFFSQMMKILKDNGPQFLRGTGMTLLISMTGTIAGLIIGLLIGVFRTAPTSKNKALAALQKFFGWFLNVYIEIFRGTPMIVQSMVIFYGSAQAFNISLDRTWAAIFIVSINTGAYMSEIVRGGILAVDTGQFEAATALGMTHGQTMRKVVLPQVVRNILPATGNEFVINIKDTSVLNVISVVELYFTGNTVATQNYQYFPTFTIIAVIYFILTFTITRILRYIERRLDSDTYTTGANQMQVKEVK